jgi:elongation factor G
MGELHLDVYIERMKREYKAQVEFGMPQVAYREAISRKAEFDHVHKKQTGGAGQFARVAGTIEPYEEDYVLWMRSKEEGFPGNLFLLVIKVSALLLPKEPLLGFL